MKTYLLYLLLTIYIVCGCRTSKETTTTTQVDVVVPAAEATKDIVLPADSLADAALADTIVNIPEARLTDSQKAVVKKAIQLALLRRPVLRSPVFIDTLGLRLTLRPVTGGIRATIGSEEKVVQGTTTTTTRTPVKPAATEFLKYLNWSLFLLGLLLLLYIMKRK